MPDCITTDASRSKRASGLVQSHKFGHKPFVGDDRTAQVEVYADLVKVKVSSTDTPGDVRPRPRGDRQRITVFSKRSRKAMLEELAKLRNPTGGYFCTLTYPGSFTYTPQDVKTHLERFRKAFLRQFPGAGVFWRMELKIRRSGVSAGVLVPHFHLLAFLGSTDWTSREFRAWLAWAWWRSVGSGDEAHRRAGTQADMILNRKHAQRYASKYAAKEDEDGTLVLYRGDTDSAPLWGRRWGKFGELDTGAFMVAIVSLPQMHQLRRMVRSLLKSRGRSYAGVLARLPGNVGFSAFGLGDLSHISWDDFTQSTIAKMLMMLA